MWRGDDRPGARRWTVAPRTPDTEADDISTNQEPRLNADIKVPRVRLVSHEGEQVGIVALVDALNMARDLDMDLVEVAPQADPPVCRIMDYGRFKYQEAQKQKEARKRQSQIVIKEIKMRPKISDNDYNTKAGHVRRFLLDEAKVKATIMFRGREMTHTELGKKLLDRLAEDMSHLAAIEAHPKVDGRNMVMVLAPLKEKEREAIRLERERAAAEAAEDAQDN